MSNISVILSNVFHFDNFVVPSSTINDVVSAELRLDAMLSQGIGSISNYNPAVISYAQQFGIPIRSDSGFSRY
jgi:hypothetical protein